MPFDLLNPVPLSTVSVHGGIPYRVLDFLLSLHYKHCEAGYIEVRMIARAIPGD